MWHWIIYLFIQGDILDRNCNHLVCDPRYLAAHHSHRPHFQHNHWAETVLCVVAHSNVWGVSCDREITGCIATALAARFMGPTWGRQDPGGPHVGTMWATWAWLSWCSPWTCLEQKYIVIAVVWRSINIFIILNQNFIIAKSLTHQFFMRTTCHLVKTWNIWFLDDACVYIKGHYVIIEKW